MEIEQQLMRERFLEAGPRCTLLVGVDVAFVAVVAESVDAFGDLYLLGTFTERELRDSVDADGNWDMYRLTTRLAAKESVIQALQLSHAAHADIEVLDDLTTAPRIRFSGLMAKRVARLGVTSTSVSISEIDDCIAATCFVVAQFPPARRVAQHIVTMVESARRRSPNRSRSAGGLRHKAA